MKRLLILAVSIISLTVISPDIHAQSIFESLKNKAIEKAKEKLESTVDKTVDDVLNGKSKSKKSKKNKKSQTSDEQTSETYDNTENTNTSTDTYEESETNEASASHKYIIVKTPDSFVWTMNGRTEQYDHPMCGIMPSNIEYNLKFQNLINEMMEAVQWEDPAELEKRLEDQKKALREIDENPDYKNLTEEQKDELRKTVTLFSLVSPEKIEKARKTPKPDFKGLLERFRSFTFNKTLYSSAVESMPGYYVVRNVETHKYGFIDEQNKLILPFEFSEIDYSEKEPYLAVNKGTDEDSYCGLYDYTGRQLLPCIYNYVGILPGFSVFGVFDKKTLLCGFFDKKTLKQTIPFQFADYEIWHSVYKNGETFSYLALRDKNRKEGALDVNGKVVLPCILEKRSLVNNYDDYISVVANGKQAILNWHTWELKYE